MARTLDLDPVVLRLEYLEGLDELERAYQQLRRALDDALATVPGLREHVDAGRPIRDVTSAIPEAFEPKPLRTELSEAVADVERVRHKMQRAFFSLLVCEGVSMAEIGRMVGISRSLVSRIVHDRE